MGLQDPGKGAHLQLFGLRLCGPLGVREDSSITNQPQKRRESFFPKCLKGTNFEETAEREDRRAGGSSRRQAGAAQAVKRRAG